MGQPRVDITYTPPTRPCRNTTRRGSPPRTAVWDDARLTALNGRVSHVNVTRPE